MPKNIATEDDHTIDCEECGNLIVLVPDPERPGSLVGDFVVTPTQRIICRTCALTIGLE